MSGDMDAWLQAGRHLPTALRDFHEQKALFTAMHTLQDAGSTAGAPAGSARTSPEQLFDVSPAAGHAYVIDRFLWFMARRGWTLQRSRADLPFSDLKSDVEAVRKARSEQFQALVRGEGGADGAND